MASAMVSAAAGSARERARALHRTALDLCRRGSFQEAVAPLREALRLDPDHPAALTTIADVFSRLDRPAGLVEACRALLADRPDHFEALHRLGEALAYLDKFDEALACFRAAVRVVPASPSAQNGVGIALSALGRDAEAVVHFRRALEIHPFYVEARRNLGRALRRSGSYEEAAAHLARAVDLKPDFAEAHNERGLALSGLRRYEEALACYERTLALVPGHFNARVNRAMTRLMLGDYARGWAEFEWRHRNPELPRKEYPRPPWCGEPLQGRTILLTAEQGVGDVFQFLRFVPDVRARGAAEVVVLASDDLADILKTCPGVDRTIARVPSTDPGFDVHVPLASLPGLLGTTVQTIPAPIPYLAADPVRVERWRGRLAEYPGFRVGVAWQGNAKNPMDPDRSFPLALLEPLARVPGVRLVSLQKGFGSEQVAALGDRFSVVDFGDDLDPGLSAFLDTAAIMMCLDLVVSADTSTVHLAGALGVPTWLPLSTAADWRWLDGRDDSPWYPSVRLFRQDRPRAWDPVFDRMAAALAAKVAASRPASRPIVVEVAAAELIDKISILQIKAERIADTNKLAHIRAEMSALESVRDHAIPPTSGLDHLTAELRVVNEAIWDVEEALRACEREGDFGPRFVELARSVYRNNDRRAALKRAINDRLGSRLVEEKSYRVPGAGSAG
jgi:tetratricopeptide (TPR) repeat protein